jgi:ribosomal protein S18 acetylase RimI-like enzyme
MTDTYQIRRATTDDVPAIFGLIGEAAAWLQTAKRTNQWARPWPNKAARDARVRQGIKDRLTWMVEDNGTLVGTVTCREHGSELLWTPGELSDPAVYVSRLIVNRSHARRGIGATLLDWAGQHGAAGWNARWIRVDVWTTNDGLHGYYKGQGFRHLRTVEFENEWDYPSGALFQKPTTDIDLASANSFTEIMPATPESFGTTSSQ